MKKYNMPDYCVQVLGLFKEADCTDGILWGVDGTNTFRCHAMCSDTFYWGTADAETIEPDDLELLEQCYNDLKEFDEEYYLPELFSARKRRMRPMRLWLGIHPSQLAGTYKGYTPNMKCRQLFLDAGPERDPKSEG